MFIETTHNGHPFILNTSQVVYAELYNFDVGILKKTSGKALHLRLIDGDLTFAESKERDFIWKVLQDNVAVGKENDK